MDNSLIIQSWVVYSSILLICPFILLINEHISHSSAVLSKTPHEEHHRLLFGSVTCVIIYTFFMGCRYGSGVDYFNYIDAIDVGFFDNSDETIFSWICQLVTNHNLHYSVFFVIMAFLQIICLFFAFRNYPEATPFIFFSFVACNVMFSWQNTIRQGVAISLFFIALSYMDRRKIFFSIISIVLATQFHKSVVIVLPAVFAVYLMPKGYFRKVQVLLLFYVAAIIMGRIGLADLFYQRADFLVSLIGYEDYLFGDKIDRTLEGIGVGYFVIIAINCFLISCSGICKKYYQKPFVNASFDIYYIGVLLHYLINGNQLLDRLNYYFHDMVVVFGGFTLAALYGSFRKTNKNYFLYLFLLGIVLFCLIFIGYMSKIEERVSIYMFIWQE